MQNLENSLIEIFCEVDDFCIIYKEHLGKTKLELKEILDETVSKSLSLSEIMTIIIFFHLSNYRTFKSYYCDFISNRFSKYFPNLVSYNRFIELMEITTWPIILFNENFRKGRCTGVSFIDSTPIKVCHNKRINSNKVFKGKAARGKSSTGWFYGFKLHLIINDMGEILSFSISKGNCDDRNEDIINSLTKNIKGHLFGDRGYISQKLFNSLYEKGIKLVTKIKTNMKNTLMDMSEKILLRKRAVIESVNDFLKNTCQIEHSRHRKPKNFIVNLISGIVAYSYLPKKPSLNLSKNFLS